MKVMTILGTRPEIIRLSRVISLLDSEVDHFLLHTGQNYDYELNRIFFEDLSLRQPDLFLDAVAPSAAATIGNIIGKTDGVLGTICPDAVLVLGDTNSALAVIAAKRRKIPIFHMEAGNRCFDARVPEETNRRIIDHISDINMPYTAIAREYLLREGLPPDRIVRTGSPMREVLEFYTEKITSSTVLADLGLESGKYIVASSHREENVDDPARLGSVRDSLNALAQEFGVPVVFSCHPRTRKRLESQGITLDKKVRIMRPLRFSDYVQLEERALLTVSDSGTITEESSILRFPAINLREAHERPEGMEEGVVPLSGVRPDRVLECARAVTRRSRERKQLGPVRDYEAANVSEKVLNVILSYTDYVNRTVWQKQ